MSSDSPSPLRPRFAFTPTMKIVVLAWLVVVIGGGFLFSINNANTTAMRDDVDKTQKSLVDLQSTRDAGRPELLAELEAAREESRRLTERINRLETGVGGAAGINEQISVTQSERAVTKAKTAALTGQAGSAVRDLDKLKKLQSDWAALEASLLKGAAGTRIVGSPQHLQLVVDIWQRERPSAEQIVQWESQVSALTEPITQLNSDQATISITEEHAKLLSDLGQELKKQAAEFEQQKLLLESIQRETSALPPGNSTLAEAIEQHRRQQEQAEADRLAQARAAARSEAEKEGTDRIAKAERELAEAKTKQEVERIESEKEQLAEEARVAELQRKATLAGLTEEATRASEGLRWAQLEREMQRDMNEIKGLLLAYTAPGFTYRPDNTKGPVSYSLIKSSGGLEPTRRGLDNLFFIGRGNTDRPRGGLPEGVGGILGSDTSSVPIERAQELLVKYGELMVRKEMLAP